MDPDKDHAPAIARPLLGNIEDWALTSSEDVFLVVRPKEERIAELKTIVYGLMMTKHCPKSVAASLRGKLIHVAGASAGKNGQVKSL